VILGNYLSSVLHPYIAHCQYLLTDGSFLPFIKISVLGTPHATCIFMSHRLSLVKPSPLQFRALHIDQYALVVKKTAPVFNFFLSFLSFVRYQSGPIVSEDCSEASYNFGRGICHSKTTYGTLQTTWNAPSSIFPISTSVCFFS
jgi:hypothetical protein